MKEYKVCIRKYFDNYLKWYPEKWTWCIQDNDQNSHDLYMHFRARKSNNFYENADKLPCFDSIEKDAAQFDLNYVSITDFFGIKWEGHKGTHAYVGYPDYEQHLYFFLKKDDEDEGDIYVSDEYTVPNPPAKPDWAHISKTNINEWIDIKNISDVDLHWVKENHLHKDSYIVVAYDGKIKYSTGTSFDNIKNKDYEIVGDIVNFICALREDGKMDLYNKLVEEEEKHFEALRSSNNKDEIAYAPKKIVNGKEEFISAQEYYDQNYQKGI